MDYIYKGAWTDQLQTKVREWVTGKFVGWKEEDPGSEFAEYVQELIVTGKKSIAEIEIAFEELALGEGRARELAIGLGDLLRKFERASSSSSSSNPLLAPLRTSREANKAPPRSARNEEPTHMGALRTNREGRDNNHDQRGPARDTRPARDTITNHLQQPMQHQQQQLDIHSRLGKRVSEDDHSPDKRNRRDTSQTEKNGPAQHDTITYITRMNQVAQEAGFANAREMMAMLGPNALQPGPLGGHHVPVPQQAFPPYGAPPPSHGAYGAGGEWYPPHQGGGNEWGYGGHHGYPPHPHMDPSMMMMAQQPYHYPQQQYGYNNSGRAVGRGAGRGGRMNGREGQPPPPPANAANGAAADPAATASTTAGASSNGEVVPRKAPVATSEHMAGTAAAPTATGGRGVNGGRGRGRSGRGEHSFSWVNPGLVNGGAAASAPLAANAVKQAVPAPAAAVSRNPFAVGGSAADASQSAVLPVPSYQNETAFVGGRGGRFPPAGRGGRGGYAAGGRSNNVFALATATGNEGPGAMGYAPQHKVWVRPTDTESSLANTR